MDFDTRVKLAVYGHFAETGRGPTPAEVARRVEADGDGVVEAYRRLRAQRVLVLEADGSSIRMAPPFSGVPTQHVVQVGEVRYHANCAWDALGIPALLQTDARIDSVFADSGEPVTLTVADSRVRGQALAHFAVPFRRWYADLAFT